LQIWKFSIPTPLILLAATFSFRVFSFTASTTSGSSSSSEQRAKGAQLLPSATMAPSSLALAPYRRAVRLLISSPSSSSSKQRPSLCFNRPPLPTLLIPHSRAQGASSPPMAPSSLGPIARSLSRAEHSFPSSASQLPPMLGAPSWHPWHRRSSIAAQLSIHGATLTAGLLSSPWRPCPLP
jgi:hypothetical protein